MQTTMYLIRHAATEPNPAQPAHLQGRRHNPALARLGVRQAELTRDFLAVRSIEYCYSSPMLRALQTASIIAAPHGLSPVPLEDLVESDFDESFGVLETRVTASLESLFLRHAGQALLVVAHQDVNGIYIASLLGLGPEQAGQVHLDNCGISVVVRDGADTTVSMLNASFHLQGVAA